jgi:hypothetical protein
MVACTAQYVFWNLLFCQTAAKSKLRPCNVSFLLLRQEQTANVFETLTPD